MKTALVALGLAFAGWLGLGGGTAAAAICPQTGNTNTDCGYIITDNPDGTITGAVVPGANPFDGSDDALIGVINNSSTPLASLMLSGSGNGGGIFGFDFDGICTFVTCSYSNPTTYEGPQNTFSNYDPNVGTSGEVDFTNGGLAPGATTYFSLEGSPSSLVLPLPPTPPPAPPGSNTIPEPATLALFAFGVLGLAMARKRIQI